MASPEVQYNSIESSGLSSETAILSDSAKQRTAHGGGSQNEFYWLNRAFYIIGAVAGVGFLFVLFGAYVVPEIWADKNGIATMIAGTVVVTLAAIAWIVAATVMITIIIRQLLRSRGRGI